MAFERDIDQYVIQIGIIDATLSGERGTSVTLSATSANESLVRLKCKIDVEEQSWKT